MITPTSVQGKCYCGGVQFELTFPNEFCSHCHCEDCRQAHGAAFVTWTGLPKSQFRFIAGEDKLKKYESRIETHQGIRWGFCSDCGTSLLYDCDQAPDKIYITVANLTGKLDREPDSHVSFEEKVNWLSVQDSLPKYREKTDQTIEASAPGALHHLDINVSDLKRSSIFWGWFLTELGYSKHLEWKTGMGWKLGNTYIDLIQVEAQHAEVSYHRKRVGLNHLAFHATSRAQVDQITEQLKARGITVLYCDRHPFAGGSGHYAVFFEDPDRIKVELVAPLDK